MLRTLPAILFALLLLMAAARADSPLGAPDAPPVPTTMSAAEARKVLDVLRDEGKRAQVISVLEAIAKTAPAVAAAPVPGAAPAAAPAAPVPAKAAAPAPAAAPAAAPAKAGELPIPLAPNSLGAEILVGASERLTKLTASMMSATRVVTDFPLITRWIGHLIRNPEARDQVLAAAWRLVVVMAVSVAAERLSVRLTRPMVLHLAVRAPDPPPRRRNRGEAVAADSPAARARRRGSLLLLLRRLPFVLGRLALDLLPLLVLAAAGYAVLSTPIGDRPTARLVILAVLNAYLLTRFVVVLTRVLLAPFTPRLRLVPLSDDAAGYLTRWVRRIAIIAIFGYAATEVGLLFGLYRVAHDALLKLVVLAVHLCLVIMVMQKRRRVAELIRGRRDAPGAMAMLRQRLAAVWHIIAIFYIVALWLVWAFEVPDGFGRLIRIFIAAVVIGTLARLVNLSAVSALDRIMREDSDFVSRYPRLSTSARRYHLAARATVSGVITAIAAIVLFEAWGLNSFAWFATGALGDRVVSALISIGLTLIASVIVWELANGVMQHRLARTSRDGQAARIRTLLPMMRTALLVAIVIVAGLIVLSDIGVNIAPLLAGAGVIGIAIGFGSQKLVQDLITGIFLLFENAMQVGDWVTVSGLSGTVEHLSIRTIRLRAGDGSVHIIPFSSVTSVTNVNRGIGNASVSVSIAYEEDVDRVCTVLAEIATAMHGEPRFATGMVSELQLWGVDKVEAGGVTIVGQIVCTDAARWPVQREFNRRMRQRFAELGIRLAMPVQRNLLDPVPLQGAAPQEAATPAGAG